MNNDVEFIRNIKENLRPDIYEKISSREKLTIYAMLYLEKNEIKLLFNYICVTVFKLFPERFGFGEFKEYPHIEMLNRTILHLRPKESNYAEGSVRQEYKITDLGYHIANEVERQLNGEIEVKNNKTREIDLVKKNPVNDLKKIEQSKMFQMWTNDVRIEEEDLWNFFKVTPYSRVEFIKKEIRNMKESAKKIDNTRVYKFIIFIEKFINSLI